MPISPRAPSSTLQVIAKTDELPSVMSGIITGFQENPAGIVQRVGSKGTGDFRDFDRDAAADSVAVLHSDIDIKFLTVERIVAAQTESLRSLRDLAIEFEAKMTRLSSNIETLCEKARAENLEMMSEEQKAELARRKMKAMFAFIENSQAQPAPPPEPAHQVNCPQCLSQDTRPAKRLSMLDKCLLSFSLNPRRCRACGSRFYRIRWTALGKRSNALTGI